MNVVCVFSLAQISLLCLPALRTTSSEPLYHTFSYKTLTNADFVLNGVRDRRVISPSRTGLNFRFDAKTQPSGIFQLEARYQLKADFKCELQYEIISASSDDRGMGAGVEFALAFQDEKKSHLRVLHSRTRDGKNSFEMRVDGLSPGYPVRWEGRERVLGISIARSDNRAIIYCHCARSTSEIAALTVPRETVYPIIINMLSGASGKKLDVRLNAISLTNATKPTMAVTARTPFAGNIFFYSAPIIATIALILLVLRKNR